MARRILVIGGLAAGPSAASKAARTSPDAEVVLFEQGDAVSYGICEIPYYVAGEVKKEDLMAYTPETLRSKKRVEARVRHRVVGIQPHRRVIRVRDLRTGVETEEQYDRLIIATGSRARRLGLSGEEARNVFRVKALDEGYALRKYIEQERPPTGVIVGGGYIGMEMAEALSSLGVGVTMLHNASLPMKGLERDMREKVREELEKHGVQFVALAKTGAFVQGKDQCVTHVVTDQGSFDAGIVIVAVGVEPDTDLARAAGIRTGASGGILTDQRQQTSADNIYAAGDCCEVRNLLTGRSVHIPLATVASKTGWIAGENAAGGSAAFRGAIRSIAVRVFGLEVGQVGISSDDARAAGFDPVTEVITGSSRVAVMPGSAELTIRLIADRKSHRLLGANLIGREGAILRGNTLAAAIHQRVTVEEMQQWDLAYSPPYAPLWDPILVAANVMQKKLRTL